MRCRRTDEGVEGFEEVEGFDGVDGVDEFDYCGQAIAGER